MNSKPDKDFSEAIVAKLNASSAKLPPEVAQRLDQSRHEALLKASVPETDGKFVNSIQQQLKRNESLPADLDRKLNQIRRAAVAKQANKNQSWFDKMQVLCAPFLANLSRTSALAGTACLTLTVAAIMYNGASPRGNLPLDPEIGLIASADELELYENLDFYLWLAENEVLN